ncbi:MAG TPA: cytochrome c [Anaerolineae bacterium]
MNRNGTSYSVALIVLCCLLWLAGCTALDMAEQPRCDPLEYTTFFDDNRCSRHLVANTVARGQLNLDEHFYGGTDEQGELVDTFPFVITRDVLARGQERYNIFCTPCHDFVGTGEGMIVRRGFTAPPSFHTDRLRQAPVGHFYDVISNGFGVMPDYAEQIEPEDRWAIVAYIRALQLSQYAPLEELPAGVREQLSGVDE